MVVAVRTWLCWSHLLIIIGVANPHTVGKFLVYVLLQPPGQLDYFVLALSVVATAVYWLALTLRGVAEFLS